MPPALRWVSLQRCPGGVGAARGAPWADRAVSAVGVTALVLLAVALTTIGRGQDVANECVEYRDASDFVPVYVAVPDRGSVASHDGGVTAFDPAVLRDFRLLRVQPHHARDAGGQSRGDGADGGQPHWWHLPPAAPSPDDDAESLPILFVHGHRGSPGQAAALATLADAYHFAGNRGMEAGAGGGGAPRLRFATYALDFAGAPSSAFDAGTLAAQAWFANAAATALLARHPRARSVVGVGHSMGGVVLRLAAQVPVLWANASTSTEAAIAASTGASESGVEPAAAAPAHLSRGGLGGSALQTLVTLNTPHQAHPYTVDPRVDALFALLRAAPPNDDRGGPPRGRPVVVSLSGGSPDAMVRPELTSLAGLAEPPLPRLLPPQLAAARAAVDAGVDGSTVPPPPSAANGNRARAPLLGFSSSAQAVPGAWLQTGHEGVVNCGQLVTAVVEALIAVQPALLVEDGGGDGIGVEAEPDAPGRSVRADAGANAMYRAATLRRALSDDDAIAMLYGGSGSAIDGGAGRDATWPWPETDGDAAGGLGASSPSADAGAGGDGADGGDRICFALDASAVAPHDDAPAADTFGVEFVSRRRVAAALVDRIEVQWRAPPAAVPGLPPQRATVAPAGRGRGAGSGARFVLRGSLGGGPAAARADRGGAGPRGIAAAGAWPSAFRAGDDDVGAPLSLCAPPSCIAVPLPAVDAGGNASAPPGAPPASLRLPDHILRNHLHSSWDRRPSHAAAEAVAGAADALLDGWAVAVASVLRAAAGGEAPHSDADVAGGGDAAADAAAEAEAEFTPRERAGGVERHVHDHAPADGVGAPRRNVLWLTRAVVRHSSSATSAASGAAALQAAALAVAAARRVGAAQLQLDVSPHNPLQHPADADPRATPQLAMCVRVIASSDGSGGGSSSDDGVLDMEGRGASLRRQPPLLTRAELLAVRGPAPVTPQPPQPAVTVGGPWLVLPPGRPSAASSVRVLRERRPGAPPPLSPYAIYAVDVLLLADADGDGAPACRGAAPVASTRSGGARADADAGPRFAPVAHYASDAPAALGRPLPPCVGCESFFLRPAPRRRPRRAAAVSDAGGPAAAPDVGAPGVYRTLPGAPASVTFALEVHDVAQGGEDEGKDRYAGDSAADGVGPAFGVVADPRCAYAVRVRRDDGAALGQWLQHHTPWAAAALVALSLLLVSAALRRLEDAADAGAEAEAEADDKGADCSRGSAAASFVHSANADDAASDGDDGGAPTAAPHGEPASLSAVLCAAAPWMAAVAATQAASLPLVMGWRRRRGGEAPWGDVSEWPSAGGSDADAADVRDAQTRALAWTPPRPWTLGWVADRSTGGLGGRPWHRIGTPLGWLRPAAADVGWSFAAAAAALCLLLAAATTLRILGAIVRRAPLAACASSGHRDRSRSSHRSRGGGAVGGEEHGAAAPLRRHRGGGGGGAAPRRIVSFSSGGLSAMSSASPPRPTLVRIGSSDVVGSGSARAGGSYGGYGDSGDSGASRPESPASPRPRSMFDFAPPALGGAVAPATASAAPARCGSIDWDAVPSTPTLPHSAGVAPSQRPNGGAAALRRKSGGAAAAAAAAGGGGGGLTPSSSSSLMASESALDGSGAPPATASAAAAAVPFAMSANGGAPASGAVARSASSAFIPSSPRVAVGADDASDDAAPTGSDASAGFNSEEAHGPPATDAPTSSSLPAMALAAAAAAARGGAVVVTDPFLTASLLQWARSAAGGGVGGVAAAAAAALRRKRKSSSWTEDDAHGALPPVVSALATAAAAPPRLSHSGAPGGSASARRGGNTASAAGLADDGIARSQSMQSTGSHRRRQPQRFVAVDGDVPAEAAAERAPDVPPPPQSPARVRLGGASGVPVPVPAPPRATAQPDAGAVDGYAGAGADGDTGGTPLRPQSMSPPAAPLDAAPAAAAPSTGAHVEAETPPPAHAPVAANRSGGGGRAPAAAGGDGGGPGCAGDTRRGRRADFNAGQHAAPGHAAALAVRTRRAAAVAVAPSAAAAPAARGPFRSGTPTSRRGAADALAACAAWLLTGGGGGVADDGVASRRRAQSASGRGVGAAPRSGTASPPQSAGADDDADGGDDGGKRSRERAHRTGCVSRVALALSRMLASRPSATAAPPSLPEPARVPQLPQLSLHLLRWAAWAAGAALVWRAPWLAAAAACAAFVAHLHSQSAARGGGDAYRAAVALAVTAATALRAPSALHSAERLVVAVTFAAPPRTGHAAAPSTASVDDRLGDALVVAPLIVLLAVLSVGPARSRDARIDDGEGRPPKSVRSALRAAVARMLRACEVAAFGSAAPAKAATAATRGGRHASIAAAAVSGSSEAASAAPVGGRSPLLLLTLVPAPLAAFGAALARPSAVVALAGWAAFPVGFRRLYWLPPLVAAVAAVLVVSHWLSAATAGGGRDKRAPSSRGRGDEPPQPLLLTALEYEYAATTFEELVAKRAPLRAAHLALAEAWRTSGRLVLGGAFSEPPLGGLLIFRGDRAAAEAFAAADPYVSGGVVRTWRARPWTVVVGALPSAATS